MAKFDKFQVMAKIAEAPMVPVFYNKDVEVCKNVIKACYEGGVRAFEFTNRGDFAHEVFGELSKWVNKECPELARMESISTMSRTCILPPLMRFFSGL